LIFFCQANKEEEAFTQLEKSSQARDYPLPALFVFLEKFDQPFLTDIIFSPKFQALRAKIKTS